MQKPCFFETDSKGGLYQNAERIRLAIVMAREFLAQETIRSEGQNFDQPEFPIPPQPPAYDLHKRRRP